MWRVSVKHSVSCDDKIVDCCGWLFFSVSENLHMVKYQSLYQKLNLPCVYERNVSVFTVHTYLF